MSTYGSGKYGEIQYTSSINSLQGVTQLYVGSEPTSGKEANAIFDELELFFETKSDVDITTLFNASQASTYTTEHQLLAHFDGGANGLEGGNLSVDNLQVTRWRLFRKKSADSQYALIATVDNDGNVEYTQYYDYELANQILYDFALEGVADNGTVTNKYEVKNVQLDFWGSILVNTDTDDIFQFYYNLSDDSINPVKGRVEQETYSQYPTVIRNEVDYSRGSIEALVIESDPEGYYSGNTNVIVNKLKSFEGVDNLILKLDSGFIGKVDIYNIVPTFMRIQSQNKAASVRFDWCQIGSVS